jgi:hypothetical protein
MTIALVRWHSIRRPGVNRIESSWSFFPSRAAALAAAPGDGAVWSIVDIAARPKVPLPDIGEIVWRTKPPLDPPYPVTRKGTRASW